MASNQRRNTVQCVDKETKVARKACLPLHACPKDGAEATVFRFKDNWDDFVGSSEGTGGKWYWQSSFGDHSGVLVRTADSRWASVSTPCVFSQPNIEIRADVLPRKYIRNSKLTISVDGVTYATITLPGPNDENDVSNATIATENGASSNMRGLITGKNYNDLLWTNDWVLTITLPTLPKRTVPLTLTHTATGSGSSDIALDNIVVLGENFGPNNVHLRCVLIIK